MHEPGEIDGPKRELADALARLRPAAPALDRHAIAFEAGRRSMRRPMAAWRGTAALMTLALAATLTAQVWRSPVHVPLESPLPTLAADDAPSDAPVEPMPVPDAAPSRPRVAIASPPSEPPSNYFDLRARVLAFGIDALPPIPTHSHSDSMDDLMDDPLLREVLRRGRAEPGHWSVSGEAL